MRTPTGQSASTYTSQCTDDMSWSLDFFEPTSTPAIIASRGNQWIGVRNSCSVSLNGDSLYHSYLVFSKLLIRWFQNIRMMPRIHL